MKVTRLHLPNVDAPKCLACGKALRRHMKTVYNDDPLPAGWTPSTIKEFEGLSGGRHTVCWTGAFGNYGDNRFCGMYCGYTYAVQATRWLRPQ